MKNKNFNQTMTFKRKKSVKAGKFFILFVFCCFFASLVFISSALSNFLCIKNFSMFNKSCSLSASNIYCVCYGKYQTENLAQVQSQFIQAKGGAGLVYKNGDDYTVLVAGYLDKQACQQVYEKNLQNFDMLEQITITLNNKEISHSKNTKDISILKNMVNMPITTFSTLHDISNQFDSGNITSSQAYNALFNVAYSVNNAIEKFKATSMLTSQENYDNLLLMAQNIYSKINSVILSTPKSQLSCNIKYLSLDVVLLAS